MNEENKSHIPGIYNYCDRWCERCTFTSQCLLFTNESKITTHQILNDGKLPDLDEVFDFPATDGEDDDASFDDFEDDFEFGDEEEEEPFFNDLPDFDEDEYEEERKQRNAGLSENVLVKLADEYFRNANSLIKKLDEKYKLHSLIEENTEDESILQLNEGFRIIEWYHMFIMVKIRRALNSKWHYDKEDDEDLKEIDAYDMNGTAKIAIIAIENSIKALNKLLDMDLEFKNEITGLLITAGRLLNETEKEIPGYKTFIRPGLDE